MGEVKEYLGIQVTRDRKERTITLSQENYWRRVVEKFLDKNGDWKSVATPMEGKLQAEDSLWPKPNDYRSIVGWIMYLVCWTRWDLAFWLKELSRFNDKWGIHHLGAARRVLRYLRGSADTKLVLGGKNKKMKLSAWVDSDWWGEVDTRKSTSGFVACVNGRWVSWVSRIQKGVWLSSSEAEYYALSEWVQSLMTIRNLFEELYDFGFQSYISLDWAEVYEDNQGCIKMTTSWNAGRTKHIETRYHYSRELQQRQLIKLTYVTTKEQVWDVMTKPWWSRLQLCKLFSKVGLFVP